MSEELKFIVTELNKPPFKRDYNLISFDALESTSLLQVVSDVLGEIDPKNAIDIREEAIDQTAIRILHNLKICKYKPPTDVNNMSAFRQGIVNGDKLVVYPILVFLLNDMETFKQRAYLARFLLKLEIPAEFMADDIMADLYPQYEQLVQDFKVSHKQLADLKKSGFSTVELKKDIANMEDEKESAMRRVERNKKRVEGVANGSNMLVLAKQLHEENEREHKISQQKQEQRNIMVQFSQRSNRVKQQLKDIRNQSVGATPQALLQKLEEENRTNTYMVNDQLPKDVKSKTKNVQALQRVINEPAMGQADLDDIQSKIKQVNVEINQLVEKRMLSSDPKDDKLSLFRQQAAIIQRKKEAAADALRELRDEHGSLETECAEKRALVSAQEGQGEEVLKGEEFKRYVNKLRAKSNIYKKKRQELSEIRAEAGVLARTEEIIKQRDEQMNERIEASEAKHGVSGFRRTQEALENVSALKSELDSMKGRTLEDISFMVQKLTQKIQEKKSGLAPIIKELRPMRQRAQEMTAEYEQKKSQYETMAAGLESNRSKLEQEVKGYREECAAEESRYHYLNAMSHILTVQQDRLSDEMRFYLSADPNEKKRALRDQYARRIQEQENLGKNLRDKQKAVRESYAPNMKQMKMWRDFERLMECKMALTGRRGERRNPTIQSDDGLIL